MITFAEHGSGQRTVIVVHGGPAAPGSAAGLAVALGEHFRVLEPFQRGSGDGPLSVQRHVEDMHELVLALCGGRPAIVGHSWGAMLAMAYAAAHPDAPAAVVLVGSGTFDKASRARFVQLRQERITPEVRHAIDSIERECIDARQRFILRQDLIEYVSNFDLLPTHPREEQAARDFDLRAHEETWADEMSLQAGGTHPAEFAAIRCPALMLHGDWDPHPGTMIRDSLLPHVPHLDYRELARCGHYPWNERHARDEFLRVLVGWLHARL